jgi:plasmid stabilization system protein ParE
MRLRLSQLALEDIDRIDDYYTVDQWGTEQADKYVHALWDAL